MTFQESVSQLLEVRKEGVQEQALNREYRVLFLEDNPDDVELMQHELTEAKIKFTSSWTDKKQEFQQQIIEFQPDVILADYSLSSFNGMHAFHLLRKAGLAVPFILVTGALSEQLALECLKDGVDDFILKSSFKRLPTAILNAIKKKEAEQERNRIALELKKSHEELQLLVERQQSSLEAERMSIARDLHDELGQVLTALKIDVTMLSKKISSAKPPTRETVISELVSVNKLIDQITQSVKRISSGLRPETLDELGIIEAIRWQSIEFEKRNQIKCSAFLHPGAIPLDRHQSIAIFRIVQECLTNVARHSHATQVEIYLEPVDNALFLAINDNGDGIQDSHLLSSKSLGIIGLRERVRLLDGKLSIRSKKPGGTMVSVLIPLTNFKPD